MSSRVNVGPDYDDRMPNDPADVGPRAAHLQTSARGTHTHALIATGTRLFVSSVLNSLGWGLRTLDNDFVADMLKVMAVGRDCGRSGWTLRRCDQQAGPSAALVMASPQSGGGRGRSHAIGRRGRHRDFP